MEVAASSLAHPASPHSWSSLSSSQLLGNLPLWNDVVAQLAPDDEDRPDGNDTVADDGTSAMPARAAIPPPVFIPLSSGTDTSHGDDSVLDPLASRPSPSDRSPELMWGHCHDRAACLEPPPTIGMTPTLGATPIPSSEPQPSLTRSVATPATPATPPPPPQLQRSLPDVPDVPDAIEDHRRDPAADLPAKAPAADTAHGARQPSSLQVLLSQAQSPRVAWSPSPLLPHPSPSPALKRSRGRDSGSLFLTQLAKRARTSPAPAPAPASLQTVPSSGLVTPTSIAPATTSPTPRRQSPSQPPAAPPALDDLGGDSLPLDVIHALPDGNGGESAGNTDVAAAAAAVTTTAAIEHDTAAAVPAFEQPVPARSAPPSPPSLPRPAPPSPPRPAPPSPPRLVPSETPAPRAARSRRLRNPPLPPAPPTATTSTHALPPPDVPVAAGPGRPIRSTRARRAATSPAPTTLQPAPTALKRALASHPPVIPATYAIDQLVWAKWPKSKHFHAAKVRQIVSRTNTFKVRLVDGGTAAFLPAADLRPYHAPAHGEHACARESAAQSRPLAVTVVESADDADDEYHVEFHRNRKRVRKYVPFEAVLVSEEQMRQVDERRPAPDVDAVPVGEEREEVEESRENEEVMDVPAPLPPTPTVGNHDGAVIVPTPTPIRSKIRHKKVVGPGPCRPGPLSNRIPVIEVTISSLPGRSPVLGSVSKKSVALAAKRKAVAFANELVKPPPLRQVLPILSGLVFVITMSGDDDGWTMVGLPERFEPTLAKFNRDRVTELVEKHGGRIVDDLDDAELDRAPFVCLATVPKRTPKYLFALARGMPCLSCQWIVACDVQKKRVDMDMYRLPNGYSLDLQAPLSAVTRAGCMQGVTVAISGGFEYFDEWVRILQAAGAMLVDSAATATYWLIPNDFDPDTGRSDTEPPAIEWAIQCLINQRIVDPHDHIAVYQPLSVVRGRDGAGD
ncbi:hypothetical protein GGF32_004949 [Allomyces javanicus]|nr:hypothetical protein GGF32_004949 [Allomyces javanicus]